MQPDLSGGFTIMAVIDPPEKKLAKRTSGSWANFRKLNVWKLELEKKLGFFLKKMVSLIDIL